MEASSKTSVHFSRNSSNVSANVPSITSKNTDKTSVTTAASEVIEEGSTETIQSRKSKKSVVSLQEPVDIFNDPLYNEDGTRNLRIPFDLYIIRKKQEERMQNRKQVKISTITRKDTAVFKNAIKKLKQEQARSSARRTKYLKSLAKSRKTDKAATKNETKKIIEQKYPCQIKCQQKPDRRKSRSRSRCRNRSKSNSRRRSEKKVSKNRHPAIKLPPLKTKPWKSPLDEKNEENQKQKRPRFPTIVIPPFKTRKWFPEPRPSPKPKVVIEYPPLKLRKKPWKPAVKKVSKKVYKTSKLFYPVPASTLAKTWHSFKFISAKQQILSGKISQYSKKFSFTSNGKQSAFISAVSLSTVDLYPMKLWKSSVLDEIISYGDKNFRRQLNQLKHKNVIKPSDVYHKIYLKHAKFLIEIGEMTLKGIYDPENAADINSHIKDIFEKFSALIFLYNGQNYAIWKEDNAFYIFNAEDTNEKGKLVEKRRGSCCVIRSTNLSSIIEYLIDAFRVTKHLYEIFSFRVNQKLMIEDLESPQKDHSKACDAFDNNELPENEQTEEKQQEDPAPKLGLAAVLFRHQLEPTFGDSFRCSTLPNHTFITCVNYLVSDTKCRAPFISSIATVMLQICKSSLWMSATLERIFQIGNEVYYENVEKVLMKREKDNLELLEAMKPDEEEHQEIEEKVEEEDEDFDDDDDDDDEPKPLTKEEIRALRRERLAKPPKEIKVREEIPITEIKPVVTIGRMKFEISVETVNIGKILSRNPEEFPLELGLTNLFKHYDYGLIIGPDVVAVWRENNRYFMFDPNQCKEYNRCNEDDEEPFNSCLNCFQELSDLIQLYIENLSKSQRNAIYKICKIDTRDYAEKSSDWQNFKAIGRSKWILSGTISETSSEFSENNRNHQSTCMSIVALAKSREMGIFSWTSDEIDEIVRIGDEFYTCCVEKLKEKEAFENPNLAVSEIGTELRLDKVIVDLSYEEGVVYGKLHGNVGSLMSLVNGLKIFFKNDDLGIVTACNISLAVFKFNDGYFLFDSHARDELGRNFNTVDPINSCTVKGAACMIRFINVEELANHLIANFESTDSSFYSLSKVDVSARSSQAPCLYNYKPFGDEEYGAILKGFNNYHEDVQEYKCEIAEKTLCNLLSCFCYANIFNPRFWASNDINEILKIGWKFLCKIAHNYNSLWEDLEQVDVCGLKLSLEASEESEGIFMIKEKILPSLSKTDEVLEEQIQISEINRSISDENERSNEGVYIPRTEKSSMFQTIQIEDLVVLKDVLQNFDKNDKAFAILKSSLFTIGIFKFDNFYYVFDPKASMNGMLVRKRLEDFIKNNLQKEHEMLLNKLREFDASKRISMEEKMEELIFGRQVVFGKPSVKPSHHEIIFNMSYGAVGEEGPISISEKGSAYVAWFTSIDLMHQHIINKIPERFQNEAFTLKLVKVTKVASEIAETSMWNNFEKVNDDHWIVRGTFSQNDSQFPVTHRNNQDVANCILALSFKHFCHDEEWNSTVLDVILKFGDRLFRKSLSNKLSKAAINSEDLKLKFSEMDCPIFIRPFIINCSEELIIKDFIIKSNDTIPLQNFKEIVKDFLGAEMNSGILASKNYYVAIWKCENGTIMMFDPHDIGPDGLRKSTGLSSLQRFTNSSNLVEIFWQNVKELEGMNEFQLFRVNIEMTHFKDGEEDVFENFEQEIPPLKYKMISGKSTAANTSNVEMTICYAIAAHCLCQALDAEFYTSDIIDRIIVFGNELVCECCTNDEVCFKDFNLAKHTSCPDEISWNFQLNDTFTTVQMDIFRRGCITKQPCPLPNLIFVLEEFFDFHCFGVLVTNEFIVPIWKDNNEYFIFYSCRIDKNAKRNDDQGKVGLVIFKSIHELYTNILSNIRLESVLFELRTCNIKMIDTLEDSSKKNCPRKNNKKWMKKVVKEEIIMPAVSFREFEAEEKSNEDAEVPNEELKDMINNLKRIGTDKGYIKFSRGGFVCGKLSKDSKSINEISRQFHSPAICLYSAAMHALVNMNCWNGDVIDCVILSANSLYVESSIANGTSEVDITSIVTPMLINNHEVTAKAESCVEFAHEDLSIEYLKPILCELLSCFNGCYVLKSWNCWTITKSDKFYFLFDPLGIKVPGKKITQNHAVLYRFSSLDLLLAQFLDCVEALNDLDDEYKLGGIMITVKKGIIKKIPQKSSIVKKKKQKCPDYKAAKPISSVQLRPLPVNYESCENRIERC